MTAQIDHLSTQLIHQPPPSIIVSRHEALRYVESCELAEMMPSSFEQRCNASDDGGGTNEDSSSTGEYIHARHLWRRQRSNNNSSSCNSDDEYNQLSMFWTAAKYCYLWSTGGVSSSLNSTTDDDESNLPYSTLMLRSLRSNAESSLEPLATYSKELVSIFRSRVNDRLHSSFDDIREDEFML
eukprot:scaffold48_cov122-Skeletonema_menzelii.AAC.1